jgi:hypothetical protein
MSVGSYGTVPKAPAIAATDQYSQMDMGGKPATQKVEAW